MRKHYNFQKAEFSELAGNFTQVTYCIQFGSLINFWISFSSFGSPPEKLESESRGIMKANPLSSVITIPRGISTETFLIMSSLMIFNCLCRFNKYITVQNVYEANSIYNSINNSYLVWWALPFILRLNAFFSPFFSLSVITGIRAFFPHCPTYTRLSRFRIRTNFDICSNGLTSIRDVSTDWNILGKLQKN